MGVARMKLISEPTAKVVVINPYAGGLLTAALQKDFKVVGAYSEDSFGYTSQILNHDYVDLRVGRETWPKKPDWVGHIILANKPSPPPPSDVPDDEEDTTLTYMLRSNADVIAINTRWVYGRESKIDLGLMFGYDYYWIRYNAATHHLPQWRPRTWELFVRRERRDGLIIHHVPLKSVVGDILADRGVYDGPVAAGYRHLSSSYFAPELRGDSRWAVNGRAFTGVEYRRVAGYPDDYQLAVDGPGPNHLLARGASPPVAMWLLDLLERNLHHSRSLYKDGRGYSVRDSAFFLLPHLSKRTHGVRVAANLAPTLAMWEDWGLE
jgi:hypothetical protein